MAKEPELLENRIQAFQCVPGAKNVCASLGFITGNTAYSTKDKCPHLLDCTEPSHFHTLPILGAASHVSGGCASSGQIVRMSMCMVGGCKSSSHCLVSGTFHKQFMRARLINSQRLKCSLPSFTEFLLCTTLFRTKALCPRGIWRVGCWLR